MPPGRVLRAPLPAVWGGPGLGCLRPHLETPFLRDARGWVRSVHICVVQSYGRDTDQRAHRLASLENRVSAGDGTPGR